MPVFYVLICIVSFTLQSPILLNIHNQSQVINMTSPIHFIHGGRWSVIPDQEIDVNAIMRNYIEFDSGQDIVKGALIYSIQRQYAESDIPIQNESKSVQLLVAWHVECTKEPHIRALLVEHDGELDEDKLRHLHQKYWQSIKAWVNPIGSDWLLDDATVLKTTVKMANEGYRWNVFITEEEKNSIMRPLWIDAER
jgi:hypothetical protein